MPGSLPILGAISDIVRHPADGEEAPGKCRVNKAESSKSKVESQTKGHGCESDGMGEGGLRLTLTLSTPGTFPSYTARRSSETEGNETGMTVTTCSKNGVGFSGSSSIQSTKAEL